MTRTTAILGAGWLGLPLGQTLRELGNVVKLSSTSDTKVSWLSDMGFQAFRIELGQKGVYGNWNDFISGADCLVIGVPPSSKGLPAESFGERIEVLCRELAKNPEVRIIWISSTSVFEDLERSYDEADSPNAEVIKAQELIRAEKAITALPNSTIIIRMGGLYGKDRHPVKWLSGRKDIPRPLAPVNLIHQEDAIALVVHLIQEEHLKGIFHGVAPGHPDRKTFYTEEARRLNIPLPEFASNDPKGGKTIISTRIPREIPFTYKHLPGQ